MLSSRNKIMGNTTAFFAFVLILVSVWAQTFKIIARRESESISVVSVFLSVLVNALFCPFYVSTGNVVLIFLQFSTFVSVSLLLYFVLCFRNKKEKEELC